MRSLITKFIVVAFVAVGLMQDQVQGVKIKHLVNHHSRMAEVGIKFSEVMTGPAAPVQQRTQPQ